MAWASAAAWSACGDGGLLLLERDLGLVDLLGDDLQLVAGVGGELGGLLGAGVARRRGGGAREGGDGQGGGGTDEQTGADPAESTARGPEVGGELFRGVLQYSVRGRHERRLSISSSATAYRVS